MVPARNNVAIFAGRLMGESHRAVCAGFRRVLRVHDGQPPSALRVRAERHRLWRRTSAKSGTVALRNLVTLSLAGTTRSLHEEKMRDSAGSKAIAAPMLLLLLLATPDSSHGQTGPACDVDSLLELFSSDLTAYERGGSSFLGSAIGDSHYYSGEKLMAAQSTDILSRTGKTEFEFRFRSESTYVVKIKEFFYEGPFLSFVPFIPQKRVVAATNQSQLVVCNGTLVRGKNDEAIVRHFERASEVLIKLLENAPR